MVSISRGVGYGVMMLKPGSGRSNTPSSACKAAASPLVSSPGDVKSPAAAASSRILWPV